MDTKKPKDKEAGKPQDQTAGLMPVRDDEYSEFTEAVLDLNEELKNDPQIVESIKETISKTTTEGKGRKRGSARKEAVDTEPEVEDEEMFNLNVALPRKYQAKLQILRIVRMCGMAALVKVMIDEMLVKDGKKVMEFIESIGYGKE